MKTNLLESKNKNDNIGEIQEATALTRELEERSLNPTNNSERRFNRDEYLKIIKYADLLKDFDDGKRIRKRVEERFGTDLENTLLLSSVCHIGQELEISEEYIQRALELAFPSSENMLENIEEVGAKSSDETIKKAYKKYLLDQIKLTFPMHRFEIGAWYKKGFRLIKEHYFSIDKIETINKRNIPHRLFLSENQRERLVEVYTCGHTLEMDIYSPIFLQACKKTLLKLNRHFGINPKITTHYDVDLSDRINN